VRKGTEERLAEFLSYVEAIPMEILKTVEFEWETVPHTWSTSTPPRRQYRNLIATRGPHYVMGDDCQKPAPQRRRSRRCRMSCATGCSRRARPLVSREKAISTRRRADPALWADESEIFALATCCAN